MKIWKRLLIFGGGLLIAGLLLKILGQFLVSEEWLEGVVEENLNCEAGIESVEVLWLKKGAAGEEGGIETSGGGGGATCDGGEGVGAFPEVAAAVREEA